MRKLGSGWAVASGRVEEVAAMGIMGRGHEEGEVNTDGEQDTAEECSGWRGCAGGRRRERGSGRVWRGVAGQGDGWGGRMAGGSCEGNAGRWHEKEALESEENGG